MGQKGRPVVPLGGSHTSAADQPEKIMALPDCTMRQLLEAGVHFGHQAHRWNPKMGQYIFGTRNNIHIIDLAQTVPMLHRALQAVSDTVAKGGRILFVGTKRQAQDAIADAAKQSAQYFVNSRWLGGTLTNWKTISGSISRLRKLDEMLNSGESGGYTKKERLTMQRERDKLDRSLGGIKDMGGVPDLLFVIDTNKEDIAIKEARRLNIPVAAIVDTNSDPAGITYAIPGNDDASRAVALYCDLIAKAAIDGISRAQGEAGIDVGAAEKPIVEPVPTQPALADLGFEQLPGPRGVADGLKKLPGISPAIEKQLNDLGIFHYTQLAELSPPAAQNDDDGEYHGPDGQGTARVDRRRHDGLQGRAHREQWRDAGGAGLAAQEGPLESRQEGRPRRGRRADRRASRGQQGCRG